MQLVYHLRVDFWLWHPHRSAKCRKPLGHSGHRRLQLAVGSSESEIGSPMWQTILVTLLIRYEYLYCIP